MILDPEKHLKNPKQSFYALIEEDVILWLREMGIQLTSHDVEFEYGPAVFFASHAYTKGFYAEYDTSKWNHVQKEELSDEGLKALQKEGTLEWPKIWYAVRLKAEDEILPLETGAIEEAIISGAIPEKYRMKK